MRRTPTGTAPLPDRLAKRLRDAGVSLAIDDFGTGYATFARDSEPTTS